jgi:hypothetical protein
MQRQYKIEQNIRLNDKVKKDLLLPALGAVVQFLVRSTPGPDGTERTVRADMKEAQHVVLLEVFKNVCGISVVDGDLYRRSKRFNIDALAQELIKGRAQPSSQAEGVNRPADMDMDQSQDQD